MSLNNLNKLNCSTKNARIIAEKLSYFRLYKDYFLNQLKYYPIICNIDNIKFYILSEKEFLEVISILDNMLLSL
jgi:hypothetical protein